VFPGFAGAAWERANCSIDFKIKILKCVGASSMYYSTISLRRLAKIFILKSILFFKLAAGTKGFKNRTNQVE
jgi:hypothetical protein